MPGNVFVSFDHDDPRQRQGFSLLEEGARHPLLARNHVPVEADVDQDGKPLAFAPSDPRSQPVRDELTRTFAQCSKMVVLIGEDSWQSEWIAWEVDTFFAMKRAVSGDRTWWRIRGMTLKGCAYASIPQVLNGQSTRALTWDPQEMHQWLDLDPDA